MNLIEEIFKYRAVIINEEKEFYLDALKRLLKTSAKKGDTAAYFYYDQLSNKPNVVAFTEFDNFIHSWAGGLWRRRYKNEIQNLADKLNSEDASRGLSKKWIVESFDSVRNEKDEHFYAQENDDKNLKNAINDNNDELKEIVDKHAKNGIKISLSVRPDRIIVNVINVKPENRNKGFGTALMKDLCSYADKVQKTMFLTPSKDFGATSVNRLKKFYSEFGFKSNKGKTIDFSAKETMIRKPTKHK